MAYMLTDLPRDVFILIIDKVCYLCSVCSRQALNILLWQLTKADLQRLSQASRWFRESVANSLWKSITIKPQSEYHLNRIRVTGLPQSCLQHATQLHFRSDFDFSVRRRCPHAEGLGYSVDIDDGDDELQYLPRIYSLAQKAESLIRRFERHQLQSFR